MDKKVFTRKSYGALIYKWSPETTIVKSSNKLPASNIRAQYCDAVRFSQGEDWVTTYCYDLVYSNGGYHRLAYVECDYVE